MYARRTLIKGAAGLSLAAVLADPRLAKALAEGLETVSITNAQGRSVSAALALPASTPAGAVMLVHEWWGLNDQIKSVAAEFAKEGFVALAIDLYDGKVGTEPSEAQALVGAVDSDQARDTLGSWSRWLREHQASSGKIGVVGWCFGGGWSLNASLVAPAEATVVYYGNVAKGAKELAALKGPVLGHFATRDQWINKDMVAGFESEMAKAGKALEAHWYEADHAFANPSSGRYDEADAKLAWTRTLSFLRAHL